MLNCKEVTHLLSDDLDRKLTMTERINLATHLAMCKGCANYRKQINFLRKACRKLVSQHLEQNSSDKSR